MNIARTLGLNDLKNSMQDLLSAGAGAAAFTLGSDMLLNSTYTPAFIKEKVNGTWLEPVAHVLLGAAAFVAIRRFAPKKYESAGIGAAAVGIGMGALTAYQFLSGNKAAKPVNTTVQGIAGLGIFADSYSERELLLAGSPTSYEGNLAGMVQIEDGGRRQLAGSPTSFEPVASFMS